MLEKTEPRAKLEDLILFTNEIDSKLPRVSGEFMLFTEDVRSPSRRALGSWKGPLSSLLVTVCTLLCVLALLLTTPWGTEV